MAIVSPYLAIMILNVNELNSPIKRHTVAEWIEEQDLTICCLRETHFSFKEAHILKVKEWENIFHANGNQKKAEVPILISDKIDFTQRL